VILLQAWCGPEGGWDFSSMRADFLKCHIFFLPVPQTTADHNERDAANEEHDQQSNQSCKSWVEWLFMHTNKCRLQAKPITLFKR